MRFFISRYNASPKRKGASISPARARGYYGRPSLDEKKKPRGYLIGIVVLVLLIIGVLVVPLSAPTMEVPPHLESSVVRQTTSDYFKESFFQRPFRRSPIFFKSEGLAAYLATSLSTFTVSVERSGIRSYHIRIQDRIPTADIFVFNQRHTIDRDGVILRVEDATVVAISESLPALYLEVGEGSSVDYAVGKNITHKDDIVRALTFYRKVGEVEPLDQALLSMVREPWQFELVTKKGWKVFLLFDEQLDQQFERFTVVRTQQLQETPPTRYVDLRYGNRVYYQ